MALGGEFYYIHADRTCMLRDPASADSHTQPPITSKSPPSACPSIHGQSHRKITNDEY